MKVASGRARSSRSTRCRATKVLPAPMARYGGDTGEIKGRYRARYRGDADEGLARAYNEISGIQATARVRGYGYGYGYG